MIDLIANLLWGCPAFHIIGIGSWIVGAGVVLYSKIA